MGIFNDFKKLLFGAKAVSKSAAEKTIEKGKVAGSKLMDESEELWDKTKDVAEDVGEKIAEKTGDIWDKTKDTAEDMGEKLADKTSDMWEKALDSTEEIRSKIKDETSEFLEDAKDVAEDVGGKILKGAGALYDKAKDVGEKIHDKGEDLFSGDDAEDGDLTDIDLEGKSNVDDLFEDPISSAEEVNIPKDDTLEPQHSPDDSTPLVSMDGPKNEIVDKAKEAINEMSEKLDETIEKAQSASDRGEETYASDTTPAEALKKDPLVNDDFFAKAAAFADGDYDKVRDPFAPSKPIVVGKTESEKKADDGTVPGFEDLDGDGNEIIDDALIIEEEE